MKTFNEKIYEKLKLVPSGKVITYKILSEAVGSKAYRAVGRAVKNNKDLVKVPCFRVVCSDGSIGDYSGTGGVREKTRKLAEEGIIVRSGRVDLKKYLFKF